MTQNDANLAAAAAAASSSTNNQLKQEPAEFNGSVNYDYPPYDHQKRSSWVGPSSTSNLVQPPNAHSHHLSNNNSNNNNSNSTNKRDSTGCGSNPGPSQQIQQQPPLAHFKHDVPSGTSSTSTSLNTTPIYHHHHHHNHHRQQQQNAMPMGNSPIGTTIAPPPPTLLQAQPSADIYAQAELYRRPTVFVSQASYASYNAARVVPPPAHNGNSRQVM